MDDLSDNQATKDNKPKARYAKLRALWRDWIRPLAIIVLLCSSFRSAVADWNDVPTGSMKPTILEGDRIFVNKLAYSLRFPFSDWHIATWAHPQRGDVVIFFAPKDGLRMVKRVVGEPGDEILIRNNHIFINGEPASYQPLEEAVFASMEAPERKTSVFVKETMNDRTHPVMLMPRVMSRRNYGPITVPEGRFFVMGDNRDNSHDSRWFGCIKESTIVGKSFAVAFSVNPSHYYLPRWSRFFMPLP